MTLIGALHKVGGTSGIEAGDELTVQTVSTTEALGLVTMSCLSKDDVNNILIPSLSSAGSQFAIVLLSGLLAMPPLD